MLRIEKFEKKKIHFLISGGGRKNIFLVSRIKKKIKRQVKLIDDLKNHGDFIESQAFAYLAIRSYLGLPISIQVLLDVKNQQLVGLLLKIIKIKQILF